MIFTAIGILLEVSISLSFFVRAIMTSISFQLVKNVSPSLGALAELFCQIENFLRRLDTYTKVTPTAEMEEVIVKIIAEVLSILAIATWMLERGEISESIAVCGRPLLTHPC